MTPARDALVASARASIARGSKSFGAASQLFNRQTRERAWLLYSWCRKCDDIADGQDHGGTMSATKDSAARLLHIRTQTERALAGAQTGDPAFDALGLVASECTLPAAYVNDLIEGFALDAADWRPQSENDLMQYCYHVAGSVGCMMAVIMGVDPSDRETLNRACDLGMAFQLANIARDIGEDAAAGRCYLPQSWLSEAEIAPGEHMKPAHRSHLTRMAGQLTSLAQAFETSARVGARQLDFRSRWAVLAAAGIYGDIAREVARRGDAAWDTRVFTSRTAKIGWVAKAMVQASRRAPFIEREGLWTRAGG